jgi:hypothetical protein
MNELSNRELEKILKCMSIINQILLRLTYQEIADGVACKTHGRDDKPLVQKRLERRDNSEDLNVDGR